MKSISLHRIHRILAMSLIGAFVVLAYVVDPGFFAIHRAKAVSTANVSGWVWEEGTGSGKADPADGPYTAGSDPGFGWVSFNSKDCDKDQNTFLDVLCGGDNVTTPVLDYGVNVSSATGDISGYAWLPNIGYISFNRADTNNPPAPPYNLAAGAIANYNKTTGTVTGWARALSGCEQIAGTPATSCATTAAGAAAGGWDGWIKLARDPGDAGTIPYGVTISSGRFGGDAWGSDVVGWIDFAPKVNGVDVGPIITDTTAPACTPANTRWSNNCQPVSACTSSGQILPTSQTGVCPDGTYTTTSCATTYTCPTLTGAGTCGDGVCSGTETVISCPKDCKGKIIQY